MIYSSLNTILQLFCAVYVTVVFDNIMFKRFWAPDYYSVLEQNIKSFKFTITKELREWMTNKIKYKNQVFQDDSRKIGTVFMLSTLMILASLGVYVDQEKPLTWPFMVLIGSSYVIAIVIYVWSIRWIWLICALILQFIIVCIAKHYVPMSICLDSHLPKVRIVLVVLIIIPILFQLVRSWCYSTAMRSFIIFKLNDVSKRYFQAKRAIQTKDKSLIPECYNSVFSQMAFDEPNEDVQLTQINTHLVSELKNIFDEVSIIAMVKAYVKNPQYENNLEENNLSDADKSVNQIKGNDTATNDQKLNNLVFEYNSMKRRPSIEKFCKDKGVKPEDFRHIRKSLQKDDNHKKIFQ